MRKKQAVIGVVAVFAVAFLAGGLYLWSVFVNYRTFLEVWSAIDRLYCDDSFNGYDWKAVKANFSSAVFGKRQEARDEQITQMLALLETSHLALLPPWQMATFNSDLKMQVLDDRTLAGGITVSGIVGTSRSAVVQSLSSDSRLYQLGLRKGMHLFDVSWKKANGLATPVYEVKLFDGTPRTLEGQAFYEPNEAGGCVEENQHDRSMTVTCSTSATATVLYANRDGSGGSAAIVNFPRDGLVVRRGWIASAPIVTSVQKGSAADRAGVEIGSTITEMTVSNKRAKVTFVRPDRAVGALEFERTEPEHPARSSRTIDGNVVIRFDGFDASTVAWFERVIATTGQRGVVLDLRFNHGGEERALTRFLAAFLPGGTVLGQKRSRESATPITVDGGHAQLKTPMAVLIGPDTASAAEVAASALKGQRRATIVGLRTSGSVAVSRVVQFKDGYGMQLPFYAFFGIDGKTLEGDGVEPDIRVQQTLADVRAGVDKPLTSAMEAIARDRLAASSP